MAVLAPGETIHHHYRLCRRLGRSYGRQTWLAQDTRTRPPQAVVLKVLSLGGEADWEALKLFEREWQILRNLHHPQIPQAMDVFSLDDGSFSYGLVHRYIPGWSLKQLLEGGRRFSPGQVRQVARAVLQILIYLHELSPPVLHRDIKPSNVIWGKDRQLYLIDFGAGQNQAAAEGKTFTVVGTYGYAPREQYGGRAVPASDLYGLGATLVHLLTGVAPMDLPETEQGIEFRSYISGDRPFANWVAKLTHPIVSKRFSSAREALSYLDTGINDEPADREEASMRVVRPYGTCLNLHTSRQGLQIDIPLRKTIVNEAFSPHGIVLLLLLPLFVGLLVVLIVTIDQVWVGRYLLGSLLTMIFCAWGIRKIRDRFDPVHSQTILLEDEHLTTICRVLSIPYWYRKRRYGKLRQAYFTGPFHHGTGDILLRSDRRSVRIVQELGLSVDELRWLAYEIDRWNRNRDQPE